MNYSEEIGKILTTKNLTVATVESCTGGLLSSKLTDVSGSSVYIKLNLVTYANEAKEKMLGVVIDEDGVVCGTNRVPLVVNSPYVYICGNNDIKVLRYSKQY